AASATRSALLDAWALLLPVECAGCGTPDRSVCADCSSSLVPVLAHRSTPTGVGVVTALRYEDRVRRLVLALKEQGRTDVAMSLGAPLAAAVRQASTMRTIRSTVATELAPVPSSRLAYRR